MTIQKVDPYAPVVVMDSPRPFMPIPAPASLPLTSEKEAVQREAVIREGMKWVGTPYHQQADILGAGVDCSMLLVRAWVDAGVLQPFDPRPYPPNWHLHHSDERYLRWMQSLAVEVEHPRAGDVAIFFFGRCFSHGGIMLDENRVIQASMKHNVCFVEDMKAPWLKYMDKGSQVKLRPQKFFDVWAAIRLNYPTNVISLATDPR